MDKIVFREISGGVCAYFLIIYSCMQILERTWFSSYQSDWLLILLRYAVYILMLTAGITLLRRSRKIGFALEEETKRLTASVSGFIGGCVILTMVLKYIVIYYLLGIVAGWLNQDTFLESLCFTGILAPFLIAAVVLILKGSLKKLGAASRESGVFLCFRVVLIFIIALSIYQVLLWIGPAILYSDTVVFELKLIFSQAMIIAAALAMFLAPLRIKTKIRGQDRRRYDDLSYQSFELSGYLLLIVGIPEVYRILLQIVIHYFSFFNTFDKELIMDILTGFVPGAFLVLAGLLSVHYGKKAKYAGGAE